MERADHTIGGERQRALGHVLWIGGSVCAGKSSAAIALSDRFGLAAYHFDQWERSHFERSQPARHPNMSTWTAMSMDERWVLRNPEEMADQIIAAWTLERFPMVVDDLLPMSTAHIVVAEGAGLFPECVLPLLTNARAGIWLVATPECIRHVRRTRGDGISSRTSNPERAFENLVARDVLMAEHVRAQAETLGLVVVKVDVQTLARVPEIVATQFGLTVD
jgi:shikimate kinase